MNTLTKTTPNGAVIRFALTSSLLASITLSGCSGSNDPETLAMEWVEASGGECSSPSLEMGDPEFLESGGSVTRWTLNCDGEDDFLITITRMSRSIEQFDAHPELKAVLAEGLASGDSLADGVNVVMIGPSGLWNKMYAGDWPLGDIPSVKPES